jgi:hypothetical protein
LRSGCSTQDTENFLPAGDGIRILAQMLFNLFIIDTAASVPDASFFY